MNDARLQELWARFVAGGALAPGEERELLEALRRDPAFADWIADDVEIDGQLKTLSEAPEEADASARAFLDAVAAERTATRFVRNVELKIREESSRSGGGTPRRTAPRTSAAREPRPQNPAIPILIAAGVMAAFALLLVRSTFTPAPADPRRTGMNRRERSSGETSVPDRTRIEQARREAEVRLVRLREEEKRAEEARSAARGNRDEDLKQKTEAAFEEVLRKRREQEEKLAGLLRDEEQAAEHPPESAQAPIVPRAPERPSTAASVARLDQVDGDVFLVGPAGRTAAKGGEVLPAGHGVETGPAKSAAVILFPDQTRIEMGPGTALGELRADGGKRVTVTRGELRALVAKQPRDQGMVFATPHAEALVLGTILRLSVDSDPAKGTRLEVEEGRVRLTNLDRKSVEVSAGHVAVAAAGTELVARSSDPSAGVPRKGLALWLRADQGVTQNGGAVVTWADRSGNNRHAVQRKPSQQPAFVPGAIRGLPAVGFDGVDDFLAFSCPVTGLPGMTVFMVASAGEERTGGAYRAGNAALYWRELEDHATVLLAPFPNSVRFGFGTGQPFAVVPYQRTDSLGRQYSLTTALKNGAEQVLFVNGRECLRLGDRRPLIARCEDVGQLGRGEGDTYYPGEIAELLVYARALGAGDRQAVEQYLLGKYLSK